MSSISMTLPSPVMQAPATPSVPLRYSPIDFITISSWPWSLSTSMPKCFSPMPIMTMYFPASLDCKSLYYGEREREPEGYARALAYL